MTIQNALNFIRQGQQENDLRIKLVKADTSHTRQKILDQHQHQTALKCLKSR